MWWTPPLLLPVETYLSGALERLCLSPPGGFADWFCSQVLTIVFQMWGLLFSMNYRFERPHHCLTIYVPSSTNLAVKQVNSSWSCHEKLGFSSLEVMCFRNQSSCLCSQEAFYFLPSRAQETVPSLLKLLTNVLMEYLPCRFNWWKWDPRKCCFTWAGGRNRVQRGYPWMLPRYSVCLNYVKESKTVHCHRCLKWL